MALVPIKSSEIVVSSPQSIVSDSTELNEGESTNSSKINELGSDIQQHLQSMFYLLRPEETLKMAVKLESNRAGRTRYLVVVSRTEKTFHKQTSNNETAQNLQDNLIAATTITTAIKSSSSVMLTTTTTTTTTKAVTTAITNTLCTSVKQDETCSYSDKFNNISVSSSDNDNQIINVNPSSCEFLNSDNFCKKSCIDNNIEHEEFCLLGIDCNEKTTVGLVLRILADTIIRLDGDGGFSVSVCGRKHIFKPVSVQAMWSALQTLHKVSSRAREQNYYRGGPLHDWITHYEKHIESDRSCLNEWNAMDSLESRRPPSPDTIRNIPTEREETERVIKTALKEIMMVVDLDEVTSKYIRGRLEEHLDMGLAEFKSFIDQEMLIILGQMDAPTEIFDHVYLGSEWNASNLEELQKNGVHHILNVTKEIDNFFPGIFDYCNIRVYDDEKTDLLKHWDNTFKYITRAKKNGSKVLVHCKMGVSRSASVVIAYAMKAYNWNFSQAFKHVKERRNCIKPSKSFVTQLETYQGILDAMKNKEKLQRSKSETNLKSIKDARLLPGSQPTPLIQALNIGKAKFLTLSAKDLRKIGNRPKRWSPENVEPTVTVTLSKPQSLENLCPQQEEKESKNIRLPCSNGQNYSVSQNQAIHLQEESQMPIPSVKLIISELESNDRQIKRQKKSILLITVE